MSSYKKIITHYYNDIPVVYTYKGLKFPLHAGCLSMIQNEFELRGKITTKPLYAFFGKQFLSPAQIRERVGRMIEEGIYKPVAANAIA